MDLYPAIDQLQNSTTDGSVYFFTDAINALNNWSAHGLELWSRHFTTVEHAFHFKKFEETNPAVAAKVIKALSPYEAMRIARGHKSERRLDWHEVKVDLMRDICRAKFLQNQDAREILLATGERQLVENSPWDSFWGCGTDGKGQNMAGKILMQIRDELRASTT